MKTPSTERIPRARSVTTTALVGLVVTTALAACGTSPPASAPLSAETSSSVQDPSGPDPKDEPIVLEGDLKVADIQTPEDVAQWASQVLVVTAEAEQVRELEPVEGVRDADRPVRGRDVTVTVNEVVWTAPDAITILEAGDKHTFYEYPSHYVGLDGKLTAAVEEGESRLDLGVSRAVVVSDDYLESTGTQSLTVMRVVPFEAEKIALRQASSSMSATRLADEISLASTEVERFTPLPGEPLVRRLERYSFDR